ncbi:hypothetical protein [Streptosporangium sp. V21-05]|uniref:hypothetical protein n=1 Tax=Streptosporangium sp. V21-05 TaxID=3446115 RepID=UPI003F5345D4
MRPPITDHTGLFQDPESLPRRRPDDDREIVVLERHASREAAPCFEHVVIDQMIPPLDGRVVEFNDVAE